MSPLLEIAAKIGLSALLAGVVGAEREWTGKWAGLRTHMLISVGSTFLTHVSIVVGPLFASGSNAWDPGRIAAQIVTGVGFIGAGTIIQSRGAVHGLTTAAGLWVASAIGIAVGVGLFAEATIVTLALLVILIALRPVERRLLRGDRRTVVLQLSPEQKISTLMAILEEERIRTEDLAIEESAEGTSVSVRFQGSVEDSARLVRHAKQEQLVVAHEDEGLRRPPFP